MGVESYITPHMMLDQRPDKNSVSLPHCRFTWASLSLIDICADDDIHL
jgi:hypothetical protein